MSNIMKWYTNFITCFMNASGRKGRQYIDYRKSYLDDIVGNNKPDILFLPGDEPDMSSTVLSGYGQRKSRPDTVPTIHNAMQIYNEHLSWFE
jgi:hypothetical protein